MAGYSSKLEFSWGLDSWDFDNDNIWRTLGVVLCYLGRLLQNFTSSGFNFIGDRCITAKSLECWSSFKQNLENVSAELLFVYRYSFKDIVSNLESMAGYSSKMDFSQGLDSWDFDNGNIFPTLGLRKGISNWKELRVPEHHSWFTWRDTSNRSTT